MSSPRPAPLTTELAVLFDLDGVLLDTEPLYTRATQAVVGRHGKVFDWSLKRNVMGRDERFGAALVLERLGIPGTPEEFLAERRPVLLELLALAEPMEGAEAFVRNLRGRGVPMAVATSSERTLFELKTRRHDWFSLFDAVVCGDDPRVQARKPAPDIFLAAAADLGTPPDRCVVFEDSPAGVEAGRAAGMRVFALPDPSLGADAVPSATRVLSGFRDVRLAELIPR